MNLEQQWLGCWKGMMLGVLTNDDDKKRLKSAATKFLDKIGHPSGDEQLVQVMNWQFPEMQLLAYQTLQLISLKDQLLLAVKVLLVFNKN